jgi:hypothetical protein
MCTPSETVWVEVYERFRRRLRILAGLILTLTCVAVFDGLANYDHLGSAYQAAVDTVLQAQKEGGFREEAKAAFADGQREGAPRWKERGDAVVVDLKAIRPLHRRYVRTLATAAPREAFAIGKYAVGRHAYTLALIYGPTVLTLALLWPVLAIRRLHRQLAPGAEEGKGLQQKLNSLFFDRVTHRYGEGWRGHVLAGFGTLLVLCLVTPLIFGATRSIVQPDLRVAVTADGQVAPLDDDPVRDALVLDKTNPVVYSIMAATLLPLGTFIVLAWVALTIPKAARRLNTQGAAP